MGSRLLVEVSDFVDAATTMNGSVAEPTDDAFGSLCATLDGTSAMAGSDPGGAQWARSYDRAAQSVLDATALAVNGSYRLTTMFGRSAINYAEADAASTAAARRTMTLQVGSLPLETSVGPAPALPPAAGAGGADLPHGWGLISDVVGRVWPDGHQDRLHRAARAWSAAADVVEDAASWARVCVVPFARDDLPEADDMITVCGGYAGHLVELARAHRSLAQACTDLAHHIDVCHAAVVVELHDLLVWSAAVQAGGGLLGLVSFGTAELPTQGAQVARIAATALRVAALIDRFVEAARLAFIGLPAVKLAADSVALVMERLDGARLLVAGMEGVPLARTVRGVADVGVRDEVAATTRLAETKATLLELPAKLRGRVLGSNGYWASRRTLTSHAVRHARGVGAHSVDDYVRRSTDFLQEALENGYPMKIDKHGTIRIWDAASSRFGVYRSDGATISFYTETRGAYFDRQPGVLQ